MPARAGSPALRSEAFWNIPMPQICAPSVALHHSKRSEGAPWLSIGVPGREMTPAPYEYKKRIGAWGLIVRVTAEVSGVADVPSDAQRIADEDVWIRFANSASEPEKEWTAHGLSLAAKQLAAASIGSASTLVVVHGIEAPLPTDYQPEACALAMVGWLRKYANVPGVEVPVSFDNEHNRYVFDWDGAHAPQKEVSADSPPRR